jgi:hypothetical protein
MLPTLVYCLFSINDRSDNQCEQAGFGHQGDEFHGDRNDVLQTL